MTLLPRGVKVHLAFGYIDMVAAAWAVWISNSNQFNAQKKKKGLAEMPGLSV